MKPLLWNRVGKNIPYEKLFRDFRDFRDFRNPRRPDSGRVALYLRIDYDESGIAGPCNSLAVTLPSAPTDGARKAIAHDTWFYVWSQSRW